MAIFNSYVSLPEGSFLQLPVIEIAGLRENAARTHGKGPSQVKRQVDARLRGLFGFHV